MHLNSLLTSVYGINDIGIDLTAQLIPVANESEDFIGRSVVESISNSLSLYNYLSYEPKTSLHQMLEEEQNITRESDMLTVLNSPALFDTECAKQEISRDSLLSMFDDCSNSVNESRFLK